MKRSSMHLCAQVWLLPCLGLFLIAGCGGSGRPALDIEEKGKIAVVSFALDNSIVKCGEERSSGPGLLQNKDKYYRHHQAAVDALWAQFKENLKPCLGNVSLVDMESLADNEVYLSSTKHVPKMVMGKDVAVGGSWLRPEGMGWITPTATAKLDSIAAMLGANLLMLVEHTACYQQQGGVSLGNISMGGVAKMLLSTRVRLYEPGKGEILSQPFSGLSDQAVPMVLDNVVFEDYAKNACSAQEKVLAEMKTFFSAQKQKAEAQKAAAGG